MNNYYGKGFNKPYPGASGTFLDGDGNVWQVRLIKHPKHGNLYMRWCIDGQDPGASFTDKDGIYTCDHNWVMDGHNAGDPICSKCYKRE